MIRKYAFIMLLAAGLLSKAQALAQQPNIIIIYADDLGYGDLSSYGGEISTPHIDGIGKRGIRFTDFYVAAPVCTPSRYSLLTGSYPQRSRHNLTFALMPDDKNYLDTSETTLATYFKAKGYQTALIGKWHLGQQDASVLPTRFGFDSFTGTLGGCIDYFYHSYGKMGPDWYLNNKPAREKGYSTDLITDHAIDFLRSAKKSGKPFFLYLPYNAPHYGKTDPDSLSDYTLSVGESHYKGVNDLNTLQAPVKYVKQNAAIADPYRRAYAAMVSCLDDNIGKLLAYLEKAGLMENTMIWFISDNGGYSKSYHAHASNGKLKGQKAELWEGGIRIPAMVLWEHKIKANQVVNTPLSNMDLLPTLGSIIGFADQLAQKNIDGVNISKLLLNQENIQRDLFWKYGKQTAFRRGDWKLVNGTTLYNLRDDIGETNDVAGKFPDLFKTLQQASKEAEPKIK